jgi:hypothetical protein
MVMACFGSVLAIEGLAPTDYFDFPSGYVLSVWPPLRAFSFS